MKKLTALLLILALALTLPGCSLSRPSEKTETNDPASSSAEPTEEPTEPPAPAQVVNYEALEALLDAHAYGWIGGGMRFSLRDGRLYFPDSEYDTSAVLYYDFADGSAGTLAEDPDNGLSGPPDCSTDSIVVGSFPAGTDPLETDMKKLRLHIYDLASGVLTVSEQTYDFRVLAVSDGVVYGQDYAGGETPLLISAHLDGSGRTEIPLPQDTNLSAVYVTDAGLFLELTAWDEDGWKILLEEVSAEDTVTLRRTTCAPFWDGEAFYYVRETETGAEVRKMDVRANTDELLCTLESVTHLYFAAGDRIYYCRRISQFGEIALLYYDLSSSQETEISHDYPALGGW